MKATVQKEAEGGTITEAEKETKESKTAYEAEATINGKPYVITVAEPLLAKKLKQPKEKGEEKEEQGGHGDKK